MTIIALLVFVLFICLLLLFVTKNKKRIPPKRTEKQKQTDELITIVLPVIKKDN